MSLQTQLRKAIADSGLPLLTLARQAGVGYATVHGFANGNRKISFENASRMAKVLRMTFQSEEDDDAD